MSHPPPPESLPEVWLRGALPDVDPVVMPAAHALLQVREDILRLVQTVPAEHVWVRPGGAASIGYHVRHTGGALERLLTYAGGSLLTDPQLRAMRAEEDPGDPPMPLADVADETVRQIAAALQQLRALDPGRVFDARKVGRAGLPSTVIGLVVHAAEHSTRHAGQAITTAKILAGMSLPASSRP